MTDKKRSERFESLDALRGASILLMVLSGSIAFGNVLPAWMYHAQVPPPQHVFNPELPGISWVDLVFPFFLFSMGVAIPLSLNRRIKQNGYFRTGIAVVQRFAFLSFFAIFTFYARAWVMKKEPQPAEHLLSISCFIILFLIFNNWEKFFSKRVSVILKYSGIVLAVVFLGFYPFYNGGFRPENSDIIILVLANMSLFGGFIWMFTRKNPWLRIGILPFIMAVFLASDATGSWNSVLYNATPAPWLYKFYFLKYLFIIIPGTVVGDWLLGASKSDSGKNNNVYQVAIISVSLIVVNVALLFSRQLAPNLFITAIFCVALLWFVRQTDNSNFLKRCIQAGVYLLLLGLFFEAYQGGIKKDPSGYSYYFVTTGLAFLFLSVLYIVEKSRVFENVVNYFSLNGKNPMIAYTAGNLLLIPVLKLTGISPFFDNLNSNAFQGLLRGIIFTTIVSLITIYFTNKKFYWKT